MGSSNRDDLAPPSADFLAAFRERAGADGAALSFAEFMELALYHPTLGYYRRERARVGRAEGTDFYTATSSGAIFGELVAAAAAGLLGGEAPAAFTFVEIGAEPGGGVLAGVAHPFGAARTVRVGEEAALAGRCVVFSDELFDAQPVRRFVRAGGAWRERGVRVTDGGGLAECVLPGAVAEPWLPAEAEEGYALDAPRAAAELAGRLAGGEWTGLFLAFDYGKTWAELAEACPRGTARAYHRHRQHNALLARPGEQDLTAHVCWDWLAEALQERGFGPATVESQEAFFMKRAGGFLEKTLAAEGGGFSPRKQALMQLLHPGNLGRKFQVLHARRSCAV